MGRMKKKSTSKSSKKTSTKNSKVNSKSADSSCWVDRLRFVSVESRTDDEQSKSSDSVSIPTTVSILSWNVLAEAYCSRYSQIRLPKQYQQEVFNSAKRKAQILHVLDRLCTNELLDVVCLQEVDMPEIREKMISLGYLDYVETPRTVGGGAGGRSDGCAVYVRNCTRISVDDTRSVEGQGCALNNVSPSDSDESITGSSGNKVPSPMLWQLVDSEIVRLDDLATLSTHASGVDSNHNDSEAPMQSEFVKNNSQSNIQGIQTSFLRRNMALIVRIRNTITQDTIIVANAHLYWNPGFEYVKLCQAHYILQRVQAFQSVSSEPVVLCGDLNSRPGGIVHSYLASGFINAKHVAPWYMGGPQNDDSECTTIYDNEQEKTSCGNDSENTIVHGLANVNIHDEESTTKPGDTPKIRYLLDASLNKLCRWLRILGLDVALETDQEEKLRTGEGEMVIFDRCKKELRTLVTTSPRLIQRRDCPPNVYCIHPPYLSYLEVAMVHMLSVHGVVLAPSTFLSRCVVCNGNIIEEHDDVKKRHILSEYEAPHDLIDDGMAVYVCDGCQQGYWWNDRPTSSASRVKSAATRLLELCIRGGVSVVENDHGSDGMFEHINYNRLRKEGWDYTIPGSELLKQQLCVVDWLKNQHLTCPFDLESAYRQIDEGDIKPKFREILPFTNVTHNFVDTLDYVFFEKGRFQVFKRLNVPTCFDELSGGRSNIPNSHLLPSDIWPSDHLAIAVCLLLSDSQSLFEQNSPLQLCSPSGSSFSKNPFYTLNTQNAHNSRCTCGCIPPFLSLFEMAELRKQQKQGFL